MVSAERRALPWVRVEKEYAFEGPQGRETLRDLFGKNSQLLIYHFMFGPGWKEGCSGCSFVSDHFDGADLHLAHHDVSLVAVSHAPLREFAPFKKRMDWKFKWVSSAGSDFNHDYDVSATPKELERGKMEYNYRETDANDEMPGISAFYKDDAGDIYHTYSSYARGLDLLIGAYNFLDLTPRGRNETEIMDWMRHHDKYEDAPQAAQHACCSD